MLLGTREACIAEHVLFLAVQEFGHPGHVAALTAIATASCVAVASGVVMVCVRFVASDRRTVSRPRSAADELHSVVSARRLLWRCDQQCSLDGSPDGLRKLR